MRETGGWHDLGPGASARHELGVRHRFVVQRVILGRNDERARQRMTGRLGHQVDADVVRRRLGVAEEHPPIPAHFVAREPDAVGQAFVARRVEAMLDYRVDQ